MLIRSQDKAKLINLNSAKCISISKYNKTIEIWCDGNSLAEYSTEEKAIKVLDMIEKQYLDYCCNYHAKSGVFQVPADDEVEDD